MWVLVCKHKNASAAKLTLPLRFNFLPLYKPSILTYFIDYYLAKLE